MSALEFYGYSMARQVELQELDQIFQAYYSKLDGNRSFGVGLIVKGELCVIKQDKKYYRVIIK
jgi:hypothetical protein